MNCHGDKESRWVHIGHLGRVLENIQKPHLPTWDHKKYRDLQFGLSDIAHKKGRGIDSVKRYMMVPIPRVIDRYL